MKTWTGYSVSLPNAYVAGRNDHNDVEQVSIHPISETEALIEPARPGYLIYLKEGQGPSQLPNLSILMNQLPADIQSALA